MTNTKNYTVKEIVSHIRNIMERTGKEYAIYDIPVDLLELDDYQREPNLLRVQKIADTFNVKRLEVKAVNYRDGKFYLIDGQHTMLALKKLGIAHMECKVFLDMTKDEEASLFADQNINRQPVQDKAIFNANLIAGREPAVTIKRVCDHHNVTIKEGKIGEKKLRNVNSIRTLIKLARRGEGCLDLALTIIERTRWSEDKDMGYRAYTEAPLNIGFAAYPFIKANPSKLTTLMNLLDNFDNCEDFKAKAMDEKKLGEINSIIAYISDFLKY